MSVLTIHLFLFIVLSYGIDLFLQFKNWNWSVFFSGHTQSAIDLLPEHVAMLCKGHIKHKVVEGGTPLKCRLYIVNQVQCLCPSAPPPPPSL